MKKAFICGFLDFPHGSAPANYVQYMALALADAGYKVHLLTNINHRELERSQFFEIHKEIECNEISLSSNRIKHWLEFNVLLGNIFVQCLEKHGLNQGDIIISYSSEYSVNCALMKVANKHKIKCIVCAAELFGQEDIRYLGKRGKSYKKSYEVYGDFDIIFAISHYIEKYYKEKTKTFYLPIMSDPYEYPYAGKKHTGVTKVIYMKKWAEPYQRVIQAIGKLDVDQLNNIEFHLCGFRKEEIQQLIPDVYAGNQKNFVFHGKSDYEQLIALYDEMHFMLLVRKETQTTKANFPSKVVEAMARGVIPVVTDVGDYVADYLVENTNSHIMECSSEESIVKGICYISNKKSTDILKMSQMARETCIDKLYYKKWSKGLADVLQGK